MSEFQMAERGVEIYRGILYWMLRRPLMHPCEYSCNSVSYLYFLLNRWFMRQ